MTSQTASRRRTPPAAGGSATVEPGTATTAIRAVPGSPRPLVPYEGNKAPYGALLWQLLDPGTLRYVEPFCGGLGALLARPGGARGVEIVNDLDALLCNAHRAVQHRPDQVAAHIDAGVNELDLHARHLWLVEQRDRIATGLQLDPTWFDAQAAGWWLWGRSAWLGGGWCAGNSTWTREAIETGRRAKRNSGAPGITRKVPTLMRPRGVFARDDLAGELAAISARLARVTITCGDWARVITPSIVRTERISILLDPPYDTTAGSRRFYSSSGAGVWQQVLVQAIEWGTRPNVRVVLCGHDGADGGLLTLAGWSTHRLGDRKGWATSTTHRAAEVAWASPACT